jgi:hypothetical protein
VSDAKPPGANGGIPPEALAELRASVRALRGELERRFGIPDTKVPELPEEDEAPGAAEALDEGDDFAPDASPQERCSMRRSAGSEASRAPRARGSRTSTS